MLQYPESQFFVLPMKISPSKVAYFSKIEEFFPLPVAQATQTLKFMFTNVVYRATEYKLGFDP